MFSFQTIKSPVENILLKEKGSKFIGFAFPINSEKELKTALDNLREEYLKATHHCYEKPSNVKIVYFKNSSIVAKYNCY